ncbi:MAG: hypothetical protein ACFFCS_22695 [Candidatus Hodarchaeota archaeon]
MERNQTLLHQKLKHLYSKACDGREEVDVQIKGRKYRIDVLDESSKIAYEIQLGNLGMHFYKKIEALMDLYKVIVVYPIPLKQHVTINEKGNVESKLVRKRNDYYSVFKDMVSFRTNFKEGRLEFELLLVEERVEQEFAGFYRRRPHYTTLQRDLVGVVDSWTLSSQEDFLSMLPENLPKTFTNKDLIERLDIKGGLRRKRKISGWMTYSLCSLGLLDRVGKQGNAHLFALSKF